MIRWVVAFALAASGAVGQEASRGAGALLRALDKISGETTDIEVPSGAARGYGRLTITLSDCRYPRGGARTEAYAFLTIADAGITEGPVFQGWMLANSPALNALDHPRYDVWVLRCISN